MHSPIPEPATHKLQIDDIVIIEDTGVLGVGIRQEAGFGGKSLGRAPEETLGAVVAGPVNDGGYTWWKVRYVTGVEGWSAEDYLQLVDRDTRDSTPDSLSPLPL